ncbi:MAG: hypothetical protein JWM14_567 [Chitinophagaceae bacterium]|nr:hypothetical protein [Chitinophagaceae bacterium]
MKRLEILVEEKSMESLLRVLLPKVLPSKWQLDVNCFVRSFEGKSDLQKSIPKQVRAFSHFPEPIGVIILHDQDSADCKKLKQKLKKMVVQNGDCNHLIRIVCKELESWYIGDFAAVKQAYPTFKSEQFIKKAKYRNPDLCNASFELRQILPEFQKVTSANKIGHFLDLNNNKSESFNQFVSGIMNFAK